MQLNNVNVIFSVANQSAV